MADNVNPSGKKVSSSELLPQYYRTPANKKFLQATVDQLIQPGTVKKINGYIGRKNSRSTTGKDIFIDAATDDRQNYQLEPGLIIKDSLNNTTFFKDYQDYINQLSVFGANTSNHDRLNSQEFYSWDPHISWDKFINFQQYYWLPYGPDTIKISGNQVAITSTYKIEIKKEADNNTYRFFPNGLTQNPSILLYRGQTYRFEISSPGNPFSIKTKRTAGATNRYNISGITGHAVEDGIIEFTVPFNAPDILYYVSEKDVDLGSTFRILSIDENSTFNVETELLGKTTYTLPDGTALSNGMKIAFTGKTIPESYQTNQYYVEGVGDSIVLLDERILDLLTPYADPLSVLFDADPFDSVPFGDSTTFAGKQDYICINRNSNDRNTWSRYNRWFHKDVIEDSARYNGKIANIDQSSRAVRPIIEFEGNIKLFNFGTASAADIDLIDTYTTDVFSKIEGQLGYNIDGIDLAQGQRILFPADTDIRVKNKIFKVEFLILDGVRRIHLIDQEQPKVNDGVLIRNGVSNQGLMYWYDGTTWIKAQQKTAINQSPLFDLFDKNTDGLGNKDVYDGSTFRGTKLFSYKTRETPAEYVGDMPFSLKVGDDATLGFPLSFRNIENIGDILFNFNIATDTFQYKDISNVITSPTNTAYLLKTLPNGELKYINGWQKSNITTIQPAVRIYKDSNKTNNFDIDIFDKIDNLKDLKVRLYVNGIRLDKANWSIVDGGFYKRVVLLNNISTTDILTIKAFAEQPINTNGFYEIPISLQNNPLNSDLGDFTLGEVSSHVDSIVDNIQDTFSGAFPGTSNLRDLGNITQYGTRFVQHSSPLSLALYHITSQNNNVIRAIEKAQQDYAQFKRNFIAVSQTLGIEADPAQFVDLILQDINKNKPKKSSYYFSDMVPYSGRIKTELTVVDFRIKTYPLTEIFDLEQLSNKAVLVYLNGNQLMYGKEYTFSNQGFVVISAELANNDSITIYEFENTNGCFVPATPTKLGIWPAYEPKIYVDTSLVSPRTMIQGHDGSQTLAYGDYRDALILELEKRIFNNIKVKYDSSIFDIDEYIPSYNTTGRYSLKEFDQVLSSYFYSWANLTNQDFSKQINYDNTDPRTYNYRDLATPDGRSPLPGYWKGIHRWMLGTDRPNSCPWEMLGFSQEPSWWTAVYGPAPYTSNNLILWDDLADGIVRAPGLPPTQDKKYIRSYIKGRLPVDENGNIISPIESGLALGTITNSTASDFVFGDVGPVENAWRRSSHYPFSILVTLLLTTPVKAFGLLLDRSRVVRNIAGQLIYKDTEKRITLADIKLPSIYSNSATSTIQTSGIINYIVDYIQSDNLDAYNQYVYDLQNIQARLTHRLGGFTSKEKFKLLLDSKTPLTSGSVFVPQEDYDIILNSSSPIKKIIYSGVVITKYADGFGLKGYSKTQPFFKYYNWSKSGIQINVGGISESFTNWIPNSQYTSGKIVAFNNRYYRVKTLHTTEDTFNPSYYVLLASLPVVGGKDAYIRQGWDTTEELILPYGTKLTSVQEVADFLLGYGEYLKNQGFIFDNFNNELGTIANWEVSVKEFLFWTTQNWSTGKDKWEDWKANQPVVSNSIVKFNGEYYRAINNLDPAAIFNTVDYVKLDGLSSIGSSVISLSPASTNLTFSAPLTVVDDIRNPFYNYEIFKVDGTPITPSFLNNYRDENAVSYTPIEDAIYGAVFYLVQKEQVVVLNNSTMFNDTIYSPSSGFKQDRIKVSGYLSSDWKGDFNVPGFIFDQAIVQEWEAWKDYALGDIIKYKQFFYSCKMFISGKQTFNTEDWIKLDKAPTPRLLPNWSYKATQFADFYSLDSDNFDADQQTVAQHLIGYQKRQYLSNIIQDDVSEFKFYQGMIVEKGTQNVLNKLFDVLSAENKESIKFYEEWALRVGQYGANNSFENIEFILDEQLVKNNPQGYELLNQADTSVVDFIIRQTPNDIYLKPIGYNNNPWPLQTKKNNYLRTPGYVRPSDVKLVLKEFDDILTQTVTDFKDGNYVWVGFENREWNVYRYSRLDIAIKTIDYSLGRISITLEDSLVENIGNYIGIDQTLEYNGFYKIISVADRIITLAADLKSQPNQFTSQSSITLSYFVSNRVASIDVADKFLKFPVLQNELLWTDDAGTDKWATWKHNTVYTAAEIANSAPQSGAYYGRQLAINPKSNIAIITDNLGQAVVYDKASPQSPWLQRQTITVPFISKSNGFGISATPDSYTGDIIALSADSKWLATATPRATNVSSKFVGHWTNAILYTVGDIVTVNAVPYVATTSSTNKSPLITSYSYTGVSGTVTIGAGLSATFDVTTSNTAYTVSVSNPGTAYAVNDTIRIFGTALGGDAPENNLVLKVTSIIGGGSTGPIARVSVTGNAKVYWKSIPYIPVDPTGDNSVLENQGVISIYQKDDNNIFSLVDTLLSPAPAENEFFGSSLAFGDNELFVGANGYNNNSGKVYRLNYKTTTEVSTSYNPTGSSGTTIVLTNTAGIDLGMILNGAGFNSNQYVAQVNQDSSSIIISAVPDSTPSGIIQFTTTHWRYNTVSLTQPTPFANNKFGSILSVSADYQTLAVSMLHEYSSVVLGEAQVGKVFVYKKIDNNYQLLQTIVGTDTNFGYSTSISNDGTYLAVSSIYKDIKALDQGTVVVYKFNGTTYGTTPFAELTNIRPEIAQFFGTKISFMNDYKTLVVFSQGADNFVKTTIDNEATTFDNNLTKMYDVITDNGRIDIYDLYATKWIYSESLENTQDDSAGFGTGFAVGSNQILASAPNAIDAGLISGKVFEYIKQNGSYSWGIYRSENDRVELSKIKRAFLYNRLTNKLITYLDVIDSTQGKIPGIADQEIKFKTFYDPAVYSSGDATVNVDDGMAWTTMQVGTLWWDLRSAKFFDSHDTDLVYRNSTWNTIFPGASIDIYEWVETKYTPDKWNELADTEEGISLGISGNSLYGNSVYGLVRKYDNVAKSFKNTYYFWVKNKKSIPNITSRTMSAQDVATLIENPRGYGYKYIALTGINSFSLVNVAPLLNDKDVVLSIEYWTSPYTDSNIHSQWKIINADTETTIPARIEQKWVDSLCGKDVQGRLVPDTTLPVKLKYGIEDRPRQGMFINRFEALKQFIEYVNISLASEIIVENKNISALQSYENAPSKITGLYDAVIDTDAELKFTNTGTFTKAQFSPVIENGRIIKIDIVNRGRGYIIAPYFTISGSGQGAVIRAVIDIKGQIVGANIISSGEGYTADTAITLRNYSVLVLSDTAANGSWSIYAYESSTLVWSRVQSQSYDVRKYWNYIDWYATGYNQYSSIDQVVSTFSDLYYLNDSVGQTVKVKTTTLGTWALLEKYTDSVSIDWTQSYRVVGRENGTIQFSSVLYQFIDTQYGFDGSLYDSGIFDNSAAVELRIILESLRNNILTDTLKSVYLNAFFNSVRYIFSEQNYVDWIFKTSFVKASHNVGELKEKVTYNSDNLENFEDYINEVKPYRTKVREYVSSYDKLDTNSLSTTDFDLPPVVDGEQLVPVTTSIINGKISADNNAITQYPWKHWYDNLGYSVVELKIIDGGSGYKAEPTVKIISDSGTGATARALFTNGKINRVVLLSKGSKYLSAPTVVIDGGIVDGGTPAKIVAILGNSVVRNNLIKIKFDRITQKYFITELEEMETFTGSGSRLQFQLKWSPDIRIGKSLVTVNGVEILRANYKLTSVKTTNKGYTNYVGLVTFDSAPADGSIISVKYIKDWSLLNAADRIQFYYDPATGELGNDLAQLMTGIDYGGVSVHGLNFDISSGWDSVPYYTDKWFSFDSSFDDYIVTVAAGVHDFTIPYVPVNQQAMNVYYSGKNTDTYIGDGFTKIYNYNFNDEYPPEVSVRIVKTFTTSALNVAGSSVIKVANTTGLKIGDVLTITPNVDKTLSYNTTITQIINATEVRLNQILFKNIANGTSAVFERILRDPTDCIINTNGTVVLKEVIPTGSTINITAFFNPVRLDDPNYNVTGVALQELNSLQGELQVFKDLFNTLTNTKSSTESQLQLYNGQLVSQQATLNALLILLEGLLPGNPVYTSTVSDINILVSTTIPTTQANIAAATLIITNTNIAIAGNLANQAAKQLEIDAAETYAYSLTPLANSTAIMQTPISNGEPDSQLDPTYKTFTIPNTFTVNDGDKFIWRKSSSDGAVQPQEVDFDTALTGGDLTYATATGIAADDIIVDGDGFITPTSSPATEEVVPGQIVDAVAIKVYDKPNSGSGNIRVDSYIADGVQQEFLVTQQPNSPTALFVKFTNGIRDPLTGVLSSSASYQTLNDDYTFDYRTKLVKFNTAPTAGELVSIFSFGFNGTNILDLDYFIGDGVQTEFITKAPWNDNISYIVYVDGQPAQPGTPEFFKTDASYESSDRIGVYFSVAPTAGALINYVIVDGIDNNFSITTTERIQGNGSTTYNLERTVGTKLPLESNMLVRVDNKFLKGPNNSYYTIAGTRVNYQIDVAKFAPYSVAISDIFVYADGNLLRSAVDYIVELSGITVKINNSIRQQYLNKELIISIKQAQGYVYIPATPTSTQKIEFASPINSSSTVEVISSYKHDILNIQVTAVNISNNLSLEVDTPEFYSYKAVTGGVLTLDKAVLNVNYVWVAKNGVLLTPSVDFKLNEDNQSIKLAFYPEPADEFTITTFSGNVLGTGISYMQFKDMLNRTHFKRLNANKRTVLVNSLNYTDTVIEVEDASKFDFPSVQNNKPGIIEIRGERIEFFTINTKVEGGTTTYVLGQLRRGTLGTGVSKVHRAGSFVQDIGASETIPYNENTIIEQIKSDGTNIIPLSFVPTKAANTWSYATGYNSNIPVGYGQSDDIEVFVGGYSSVPWVNAAQYEINDIVEVGSYTYRCITAHTSTAAVVDGVTKTFNDDLNNWSFFVGNIRLKKKPYQVHNVNQAQTSPEGDVQLDAEFSVDGITAELRLTHRLAFGTRVTVVKKTGTAWDSTTSVLEDDSKISRFLKAAPGVWYTTLGKYESKFGIPSSFDNTNGSFDSGSITYDQG